MGEETVEGGADMSDDWGGSRGLRELTEAVAGRS